jgi:hypothetical protein
MEIEGSLSYSQETATEACPRQNIPSKHKDLSNTL